MFVKVTASGPRRYIQLVESFRDNAGVVRKRTVATLGRLDQLESVASLRSVVTGLARLTGQLRDLDSPPVEPTVEFLGSRGYGDVYALSELWRQLGLEGLSTIFRSNRREIDVENLLRAMVFHRLCDADSKLGTLRWLQGVAIPGDEDSQATHQQLLRAMDVLEANAEEVEKHTSLLLRPLVDQELSVVFYDLTSIAVEGEKQMGDDDLREHGMGKRGLVERQVVIGLVQTADGLPLHHEVFEGNVSEAKTLQPMLLRVFKRYPIRRVIAVADRGLMSLEQIEALEAMRLPSGEPLEFILAVPARRYEEFAEYLLQGAMGPFLEVDHHEFDWQPLSDEQKQALRHQRKTAAKKASKPLGVAAQKRLDQGLQTAQALFTGATQDTARAFRLVVARDDVKARSQSEHRDRKIKEVLERAQVAVDKLDQQDQAMASGRGRPMSDRGATARMYHDVCEQRLSRIVKVDLKSDRFTYDVDPSALLRTQILDGKLLLVTNVSRAHMNAEQITQSYKALADIERGFRVLKSDLEIGPLYHRLPRRIRAHAHICFIALILQRVMRQRLKAAGSDLSPAHALQQLGLIHKQTVSIDGSPPINGMSAPTQSQTQVFADLGVKRPTSTLPKTARKKSQLPLSL
jgi:transposase